jgi:hypothetical protein
MEPEKGIFEEWSDKIEAKSWIRKKLEFIPLWWYHDGSNMHRNFARGIKNIIYWFPIIWKDRNWDSHYIFEVLKHKLTAQANYIADQGTHVGAHQDARDMRLCVELIKLIDDDFYEGEYSNYHKTKHWFEPCEGREGFST